MSYHDFNLLMDIIAYQNELLEDGKEICLDDIGIHDANDDQNRADESEIGKDVDVPQKPQNSLEPSLKSSLIDISAQ